MTDIEKFHEIVRALRVPPERASAALAQIRQILGPDPAQKPAERLEKREAPPGRDRMHRGGETRSGE
jgi:hypothetical protein